MSFSADQTMAFEADVNGTLEGTIEYKIADIGIPKLHVNLSDSKMGVYASLSLIVTLDGKSIELEPSKSKTLTLSAKIDKTTQKLALPKSAITWKSNNHNVVVSSSGVITVSKAASVGETATITATLENGDKTYKATTKVYVISNERSETYVFLNPDDKITSIVNGRGQTFGTDYYEADSDYVDGAYKLTLPIGDYILNLKRKDGSTTKYAYSIQTILISVFCLAQVHISKTS